MMVILETMLPFIMVFESRKPQARELIIISLLCALAVAGRMAFFMVPQFKPVVAIVIIAGVCFGGEAGFLAGVLFKKGLLVREKKALSLFGGLATFIIYGGLMNPASVITFQSTITKEMIIASYLSGIPFDLVHAAATVTFLYIAAEPIIEKLDRIKIKYGLIE